MARRVNTRNITDSVQAKKLSGPSTKPNALYQTPEIVGGVRISSIPVCVSARFMRGVATFRYRVPSSLMPRPAFQQPNHRQPSALDDAVLGQRLHRVLATRRREPTRGQPQRRDGVPVELD